MTRNNLMMLRNALMLGTLAAFTAGWGCSQAESSHVVVGSVTVDGKPADGLYVVFYDAATQAATSSACTAEDGSFTWTTAEPGEYKVTAFWPKRIETKEETIEGPDRFQGKYRRLKNPAATITISEGEKTLPAIELAWK